MTYEGHIKVKPLDMIVLSDFAQSETGVVNFWVPRHRHVQMMSSAIKEVSGKKNPKVLDVNCGSGLVGRLISDTGPYVIGIDNDAEFIRQASDIYGNEKIKFVHGDVRNLPEIVRSQGIGEVDAVYCSFMPQEVDSVSFIEKIRPKVIIYVFEKSGDSDASSVTPVLDASNDYEICAVGPLISYRDLHYLDSLHPNILATGFVIKVNKSAGKVDILRIILQQLAQQDALQQRYRWEVQLDQKLAEVRNMAQEKS